MTSLEFVFGIGYQLLNIDDVMNIIFRERYCYILSVLALSTHGLAVKCDWHRHFDARRWLLLPTIEIVNLIDAKHKHGQDITKVSCSIPSLGTQLI